jgi:hypothetical protein
MNKDILDLAEMLMEELEKAGYSTVNNAGFKNISINLFDNLICVENCVATPPIDIIRRYK